MNPLAMISDHRMTKNIEEVESRLNEVSRMKSFLYLGNPNCLACSSSGHAFHYVSGRPQFISSSLPETVFVGREDDMDKLLVLLTKKNTIDGANNDNLKVIPIVGMGGSGKTALAQQLYQHQSVRDGFALREWVCLSEILDNVSAMKSILASVAPRIYCKILNFDRLQEELRKQLFEKKFFIVLDGVWNENSSDLNSLLKPFSYGSCGSRILLTTRSLKVANSVGDPIKLNLLSVDDCLSIIVHYARGKESRCCQLNLEGDVIELAEKCKGLPLAAKTIGEILYRERSNEKRREAVEDVIWDGDCENNILSSLRLSYVHLPMHLKRCFVAFALFPKGYVFDEDEIIRIWNVEGLLPKRRRRTYREVGLDYFHQLEECSLFHRADKEKHQFYMHDFLYDLAKSIDRELYFSSDDCKDSMEESSLRKVLWSCFAP